MSLSALIYLIISIILIATSAFFSGSETAVCSMDEIKIRRLSPHHAKGVRRLLKEMTLLLVSLLNANSITNILIALTLENFFKELGYTFSLVESAMFVSGIVIVFGEILPKSIASAYALKIVPVIINPVGDVIKFFLKVSTPLLRWSDRIAQYISRYIQDKETKDDRRIALYTVVSQGDFLQSSEKLLIARILSLADRKVTAVMTPRPEVFSVEMGMTIAELKEELTIEQHSKIPIYKEQDNHIIGILHFEDIGIYFDDEEESKKTVDQFMRPLYFVPESKTLESLLEDFKSRNIRIAGITEEYGECLGIVTLSDILAELVGEVVDEDFDINTDIVQALPNCYIVKADVSISSFNEKFELNLMSEEYSTMAGYMIEQHGSIPPLFYNIEINDISISIRERTSTRIESLLVRVK